MAERGECKKNIINMISGYVDGELPKRDEKKLLSHLDVCASCRALLSAYRSIREAAVETMTEAPDDFAADIMEKLRVLPQPQSAGAVPSKKRLHRTIVSFAAAAACLVLAFVIAPGLFGFGGERTKADMSANDSVLYARSAADDGAQADSDDARTGGSNEPTGGGTADASAKFAMFGAAEKEASSPEAGMTPAPSTPDGEAEGTDAGGPETEQPESTPQPEAVPQPATGPMQTEGTMLSANPADGCAVDEDILNEYYAVFCFKGTLPELLDGIEMTDAGDGTYSVAITAETAKQLIEEGYPAVEMGNEDAENAIVYYTAE